MARFLVIYKSAPDRSGAFDASVFDVKAKSALAAIAGKREAVEHPWTSATAVPWPAAFEDADEAAAAIAAP